MKRPRYLWLAFALCLVIVLAAMAWISSTALRLHQAEASSQRQAALEENVRLALWRMDSILAPLVAQENVLPPSRYERFRWEKNTDTFVSMRFELRPGGQIASLPSEQLMKLLKKPETPLPSKPFATFTPPIEYPTLLARLPEMATPSANDATPTAAPSPESRLQANRQSSLNSSFNWSERAPRTQMARSSAEFNARNLALNANNQQALVNRSRQFGFSPPNPESIAGVMKPLWIDDHLMLARRAILRGYDVFGKRVMWSETECIQGCLLDWPRLRQRLLTEIGDLLPNASLRPAAPDARESRLLAALPIELDPGRFCSSDSASGPLPIIPTLLAAWAGVLAAAMAVAVLLFGVIRLSERRAAFVSAVTHELRTPLTTLRMYAEMLSEGMVTDEQKRQDYFDTLRTETDRLGHLVENVLGFARLERSRVQRHLEDVSVDDLIASVEDRITARIEQAGMQWAVDADDNARAAVVRVHPSSFDQVLFNLVDNACKYAADVDDRRIRFSVRFEGKRLAFLLTDQGPGLDDRARARLFRPFSKSASEAAASKPGIGIGLALSRRLARDMGGDLSYRRTTQPGATFVFRVLLAATPTNR